MDFRRRSMVCTSSSSSFTRALPDSISVERRALAAALGSVRTGGCQVDTLGREGAGVTARPGYEAVGDPVLVYEGQLDEREGGALVRDECGRPSDAIPNAM